MIEEQGEYTVYPEDLPAGQEIPVSVNHQALSIDQSPGVQPLATLPAVTQAVGLIERAIDKDMDLDKLQKLLDMKKEIEADEARRAFAAAMAGFRGEKIMIDKDRTVSYSTDGGDTISYQHASLGNYIEKTAPAMSRWGLSARWEIKQEDGNIKGRCVITHALGHSEASDWMIASADQSGKKNPIQQIASTRSYIKRYTFEEAMGVAARGDDGDDDGQAAGLSASMPVIEENQYFELDSLIENNELPRQAITDWLDKFFPYTNGDLAKIHPDHYSKVHDKIMGAIEAKQKAE